jgi:hypothetical protein
MIIPGERRRAHRRRTGPRRRPQLGITWKPQATFALLITPSSPPSFPRTSFAQPRSRVPAHLPPSRHRRLIAVRAEFLAQRAQFFGAVPRERIPHGSRDLDDPLQSAINGLEDPLAAQELELAGADGVARAVRVAGTGIPGRAEPGLRRLPRSAAPTHRPKARRVASTLCTVRLHKVELLAVSSDPSSARGRLASISVDIRESCDAARPAFLVPRVSPGAISVTRELGVDLCQQVRQDKPAFDPGRVRLHLEHGIPVLTHTDGMPGRPRRGRCGRRARGRRDRMDPQGGERRARPARLPIAPKRACVGAYRHAGIALLACSHT